MKKRDQKPGFVKKPSVHPGIYLLAGPNGAGKSSIGGAELAMNGGIEHFNPDVETLRILKANPGMSPQDANGLAWETGVKLLTDAIENNKAFFYETTLGGNSITAKLIEAAEQGVPVYIWYCALASVDLHIARVRARVIKGGHDIPEHKIRERYKTSRENLVKLLPCLAAVKVYDNSVESHAKAKPRLIMSMAERKITYIDWNTPDWAKPLVAAAGMIDPDYKLPAPPQKPRGRKGL